MPVKTYDAIMVSSGITGAAAKELTEKGLRRWFWRPAVDRTQQRLQSMFIWQKVS